MPYEAQISRSDPTAFLFLIDQSGSMADPLPSGREKAAQLADVVNRTLTNLIVRCTKAEGTRDYFDIGVIGYNGMGVANALGGSLGSGAILHPISEIEARPLRVEDRLKKEDDGAGGYIETKTKFPVWVEPVATGGTPMRAALEKAAEELVAWCDAHPKSYPPVILHISDGEANDGDPEPVAREMARISTEDGEILLFNLHVSDVPAMPVEFPASENNLPNEFAKMLFRMSSELPRHLIQYAREKGYKVGSESRGFMFNADAAQLVDFFDIGTRAAQMR